MTSLPVPVEAILPTHDLAALADHAAGLAENARAANTRRAYKSDWRHFSAWADAQGLSKLPASPCTWK